MDERSTGRSSVLEVLAFGGFLLALGAFVYGGIFLWDRIPVTLAGLIGWAAGIVGITATWLSYAMGAQSRAYRKLFDARVASAVVFAGGAGLELLHAWRTLGLIGAREFSLFALALLVAVVGEVGERRKALRQLAREEAAKKAA